MQKLSQKFFFHLVFAGGLILFSGIPLRAQQGGSTTEPSQKQPIVFKVPNGYMPGELSQHIGKLFLDPAKPAGMFVGYPAEGQDMAAFTSEMQKTVAGMFLPDSKEVTWVSAALPPHKGIEAETGTLFTTSTQEMEMQLAFYVRADKGVAYGYYAMRQKKDKGQGGKFLDSSGSGVKAFDGFAKSIGGPRGN